MQDKLVSIILPVYNVALYLEECIISLIRQSYKNIEILLVDDGATDESPQICDRYAQQDARVRVIHTENGGAASARNKGINAAVGEYICFVDSDDAVEEHYIEHLVSALEQHCADAAVCGFYLWSQNEKQVQELRTKEGVYTCKEYMLRFLEDWTCSLLWNKLFRLEAIGDIRMEEGHKIDDEYFTYQVIMNCTRVAVSHLPLYYYRLRMSSVMQSTDASRERFMLDRIGYLSARYDKVASTMPEIESAYFVDAVNALIRCRAQSKNLSVAKRKIRQWSSQHHMRLWRLPISLKQKIAYFWGLNFKNPSLETTDSIQLESNQYYFA